MLDVDKLEAERKSTVTNWDNRDFTNKLEVMFQNCDNFDHDCINPGGLDNLDRKYELVEMMGRLLKLAKIAGLSENDIFSMYQVLAWSKNEKGD